MRGDPDLIDRAHDALAVAASVAGSESVSVSRSETAGDLAGALRRADRVLSVSAARYAAPDEWAAIRGLLVACRIEAEAEQIARLRLLTGSLSRALRALQSATTVAQLLEAAPQQVIELGYRRVLFSWVRDRRWIPVAAITLDDPEQARALLVPPSHPYRTVGGLVEAELMRTRRPLVVRDAISNPRVHPELQRIVQSRAYVSAPVVTEAGVVGILTADEHTETGAVDEVDRDTLGVFADGLALALERAYLADRLATVESQHSAQTQSLLQILRGPLPAPGYLPGGTPEMPAGAALSALTKSLTPRERETLMLMADGHSNTEIARRLFIAEGTVKTHVKAVLHKLGAPTRAQAIARYHRSTTNANPSLRGE